MSIQIVDEIVLKSISEIKPYFRNPRKNDKTVELLVDLIPKVGFNVPLMIDEANVIVKGHARYNAAIRLGLEELPCVVTHADEETIKLDRLADNKVSEFSEWVDDQLLHELDMLNIDFDVAALGFPSVDVEDIFSTSDFGVCDDEEDEEPSEEDRRARYEQYLAQHPQEPPDEMITSKASIDRAIQKQQNIPEKPRRYYKVVCEHCGHITFVAEGEALFEER